MASIKISQLTAAASATGTQEFEINDSGTSKKVTGSQIKTFVKDSFATTDITGVTATATELNYTDGVTSAIQTQLDAKAPLASPSFTGNPTITSNSASPALTVTQTGAGAAILVEDTTSPDASPFIVDSAGNVGIGTSSPLAKLEIANATAPDFRLTVGSTLTTNFYASSAGTALYTVPALPLIFGTNNTERMRIDSSGNLLFNSGYGSVATAYGCRAWVNFKGNGTVAIRSSGNVTSITDNGTGQYTVNFTTAMSDVNYSVAASAEKTSGQARPDCIVGVMTGGAETGSVAIGTVTTGAFTDFPTVSVTIFR